MKIRYITPFSTSNNIGKEYNECISELPDDCYIVLRDGDTMFLNPDWGRHIEQIIKGNTAFDIIGCMTNRIGLEEQLIDGKFTNALISDHIELSTHLNNNHSIHVKETKAIAGMLMIFHKSVWQRIGGFKENSRLFDLNFCHKAREKGMKIGIAKGLYIFHLYRWDSQNPRSDVKHLNSRY